MSVEVNNESEEKLDEQTLVDLATFVLGELKIHPQAELSLMVVDVATMTHLHEHFMGEPGPTDVLAFPMDELRPVPEGTEESPALLGDVVLCPTIASEQAAKAGHETADELNLLCTHGILHLLGYDHHSPDEEREMFGIQAKLLGAWTASRDGAAS
jgi:probable rRNA maturation factor